MLRSTLALSAGLALGACATFGPSPRPADVSLTEDALVVVLTDASRCTMARPKGEVWSGALEGCAIAWPYEVALDPKNNILRRLVQAVFERTDAVTVAALGTVVITDPGTGDVYTFVSPASSED